MSRARVTSRDIIAFDVRSQNLELLAFRRMLLEKVYTLENAADLLTKYVNLIDGKNNEAI